VLRKIISVKCPFGSIRRAHPPGRRVAVLGLAGYGLKFTESLVFPLPRFDAYWADRLSGGELSAKPFATLRSHK